MRTSAGAQIGWHRRPAGAGRQGGPQARRLRTLAAAVLSAAGACAGASLGACGGEPAQTQAAADLGADAGPETVTIDPCTGVPSTGKCLDTQTLGVCNPDSGGVLRLMKTACAAGEICTTDGFGALCQLNAACRDGSSRCSSTSLLEVCTGGTWQRRPCTSGQTCQAFVGAGASCIPSGTAITVAGRLRYQYRVPNSTYSGYQSQPATADAAGAFVLIVDGSEVLGSGFTDSQGSFSLSAWRAPSASGEVLFQPIAFRPDDSAALAVAAPLDGSTISSAMSVWTYRVASLPQPVADRIDIGTQLVTGDNAGALNIFAWAQKNISRATGLFGEAPRNSLAILWRPGLDVFCGGCFLSRSSGGTVVGRLRLDTTIALSGSQASPLHWSSSVISHEVGHYIMDSYSRPPGEGGAHYLGMPSLPGLAWSEGFATFSGQASISQVQGTLSPVYFTVQSGTAAWVDISRALSSQGALPRPDPLGPLDQKIEEHIVSGILWDLWRGLTDAKLFPGLRSPRVLGLYNRGYATVDLIDYADALSCSGAATNQLLDDTLRVKYGYPWDSKPLCP
ncbi:MAG: hypothetical protein U1A78_06710 [Polyangia bacterium]